jgi:hypothetical protein
MKTLRAIAAASAATALLAAPALAADGGFAPGDYTGTNSQGGKMILTVGPERVLRYGQEIKVTCKRGKRVHREGGRFTTRRPIAIDADGRFAAKRTSGRYRPAISGRVQGTTAEGTFRLVFKRAGETCKSRTVSWQAQLVGSTPPDVAERG